MKSQVSLKNRSLWATGCWILHSIFEAVHSCTLRDREIYITALP